ncbi:ORF6C domain-containing protein [Carnobacterium sp. PL17GRE32]|uniref:ORF6C domain-containing protein n=1 Tax=Carnobacterium sp. PL17GRE32 TaxID=2592355 RepID=UPI002570A23D|nr:ORF6C domain-containing protein [Carnobacterium sp. PL17GRE32]
MVNELQTQDFNGIQNMTPEDMMIHVLQQQKAIKAETKTIKNDIDYLKNIQPVNPSVTKVLEQKRKANVVKWLGGKDSQAYAQMSREVFAEAGHDFKEMFNVPRYDLLRRKDEETALMYWENWEPSTNTKMQINKLNTQLKLIEEV